MERDGKNLTWLEEITSSTAEAESPERYQYWAALASISAVVRKNVCLDRFHYILYPNIYVFLVGKSGLRKGNPVTFAKKLVQEANATRVITGRNSIQSVIKELGKAFTLEGGGMIKNAEGFMVSGELASFLVKDPEALTILTDIYDTHAHEPEWKNSLKTQGIDVLKAPCLTLLGATNEEHFKDAVADKDIKGGFIARTIIVYEESRRLINSLMDPPEIVPNIKGLSCYLKEIAKIKGQFRITEGGRDFYKDWYSRISNSKRHDPTGSLERIGDTALKVAMLISLSENLSLEITEEQLAMACLKTLECLNGVERVTMGAGRSDLAGPTALILKHLIRAQDHSATRSSLLTAYWGDIDAISLDRVMETLIQSNAVNAEQVGKTIKYTMKKFAVDAYTKFQREVN